MTAKQTSVRIELFKITGLIVLLVAGGLYIAHICTGSCDESEGEESCDPGAPRDEGSCMFC